MKVFISGASGLVGSNCHQYFKQKNWEVWGTHYSYPTKHTFFYDTLDLDNPKNLNLKTFQPQVIVHCGALTHVDYCEDHVEESYNKTVQSTLNMIKLAKTYNAKLVYISTDYVFDGANGPYKEDDQTQPLGMYAKHKFEAEQKVIQSGLDHLILRITNVYGDEERNKNFISRIVDQCLKNETLKLVLPYDQYATPICAADIARAMYLLIQDQKRGIYHIASTDFMNRVELAKKVLSYFPNANYELQIKSTAELAQAAPRPLLGGLLKTKFSAEYPDFVFQNVDAYLQEKLGSKALTEK